MRAKALRRAERCADFASAASLGGACAFAAVTAAAPYLAQPLLVVLAAAAGAAFYLLARIALDRFAVPPVIRARAAASATPQVQLPPPELEPASAAVSGDSRVVHLFTPPRPAPAGPPDASQSLHDAFDRLRRSLG